MPRYGPLCRFFVYAELVAFRNTVQVVMKVHGHFSKGAWILHLIRNQLRVEKEWKLGNFVARTCWLGGGDFVSKIAIAQIRSLFPFWGSKKNFVPSSKFCKVRNSFELNAVSDSLVWCCGCHSKQILNCFSMEFYLHINVSIRYRFVYWYRLLILISTF